MTAPGIGGKFRCATLFFMQAHHWTAPKPEARAKGTQSNARSSGLYAALLFSLLAGGCGGPRLVNVTGTATRHGKPVPNLGIVFAPEKGLGSYALTDQEGRFTMVYTDGQEGVVPGTHKVWVRLPPAGSKEDKVQQQRLAAQKRDPEMAQILRKYGKVQTTPLTIEVTKDQEINLTLD